MSFLSEWRNGIRTESAEVARAACYLNVTVQVRILSHSLGEKMKLVD